MNKLFRAGLYRLRKNKGAYACVIIPPIYSVCLMFSQYMQMKESGANYLLDPFLFHFLLVMGVLLSVFVSLYVGTEYHDGTLRNKLISGSSRNAVYGSNLWISFLVGTCSVLLAYSHVRRDRDAGFDNAAELCGRNFAGAFLCFDLSYDLHAKLQ